MDWWFSLITCHASHRPCWSVPRFHGQVFLRRLPGELFRQHARQLRVRAVPRGPLLGPKRAGGMRAVRNWAVQFDSWTDRVQRVPRWPVPGRAGLVR